MISAQVKNICTSDMNDLEKFVPEDPEKFCVPVRAMVGPRGEPGAESFDIKVCSPKWLETQVEQDGFAAGRHYLFVPSFDSARIKKTITKLIERFTGESWQEVAHKVSRIGYWEFEDY